MIAMHVEVWKELILHIFFYPTILQIWQLCFFTNSTTDDHPVALIYLFGL